MRSMFRTFLNIQDGGFCANNKRLLVFCKKLHFWKHPEFASEDSNNFVEKDRSQMFDSVLNSPLWSLIIFAKVLAICLLTLINITGLCTVSSLWPCFQHNSWLPKTKIVFLKHVFLKIMLKTIEHRNSLFANYALEIII